MEQNKIVESFFNAIEKNDFTTAESYLSNNFRITGVGPDPLGAKEYLGVHKALNKRNAGFQIQL